MLGLAVCGSRTWMCTTAAPALAALSAELAICSGVTGTAGLRPGVSAEPVTAQEIMTLRCMAVAGLPVWCRGRLPALSRWSDDGSLRGVIAAGAVRVAPRKNERPRTRGARTSGVA